MGLHYGVLRARPDRAKREDGGITKCYRRGRLARD